MGGLFKLVMVIGILWFFYQMLLRAVTSAASQNSANDQPPPSNANRMRQCSYCGVHIPEGESTQSRGHFFCCEAHRNAFFAKDQ